MRLIWSENIGIFFILINNINSLIYQQLQPNELKMLTAKSKIWYIYSISHQFIHVHTFHNLPIIAYILVFISKNILIIHLIKMLF